MSFDERLKKRLHERILPTAPTVAALMTARGQTGDFDLNADVPESARKRSLKPAAVLVPIIAYEEGAKVLFIRRAEKLTSHSGQIALPGGRVDADDETVAAAALREAQEEVGLNPDLVEVLGYGDTYETYTGYCIVPVVGLVQPGFDMLINPDEVADAFEVPLAHLMDRRNHVVESDQFNGRERFFYTMPYEGHYIWGVTAGMIRNLSERVFV
ncbi:MAG: CoA pyrophosphatase [Parvibaculales bacterium]